MIGEHPLRAIVGTYYDNVAKASYHVLDCGHTPVVDPIGGTKKRRCRECTEATARMVNNLAKHDVKVEGYRP